VSHGFQRVTITTTNLQAGMKPLLVKTTSTKLPQKTKFLTLSCMIKIVEAGATAMIYCRRKRTTVAIWIYRDDRSQKDEYNIEDNNDDESEDDLEGIKK
jgi:hypothetical protein